VCPAIHKNALAVAGQEFEDLDAPRRVRSFASLSSDELGKRLAFVNWVKLYANALYAHALAEAERGRPPAGFKLVEKAARRKWKDEAAARDYFVKTYGATNALRLETITAIEKLVGKKAFAVTEERFVSKSSNGLKLVPSSANGSTVHALEFDDLDETEENND
jgi:hypothetical protein